MLVLSCILDEMSASPTPVEAKKGVEDWNWASLPALSLLFAASILLIDPLV
jgi:hypothetical protein